MFKIIVSLVLASMLSACAGVDFGSPNTYQRYDVQRAGTVEEGTVNRSSKRAVEEHYGIKLRGLNAKSRRRAIFNLCGMDEAAQAAWEAADAERKTAACKAEDAKHAKEVAQRAQYQRPDGIVIDGAAHVEAAIEEGFREIRDWREGASRQYALVNVELGQARTLRAKDGTLDYARAMLERFAA